MVFNLAVSLEVSLGGGPDHLVSEPPDEKRALINGDSSRAASTSHGGPSTNRRRSKSRRKREEEEELPHRQSPAGAVRWEAAPRRRLHQEEEAVTAAQVGLAAEAVDQQVREQAVAEVYRRQHSDRIR